MVTIFVATWINPIYPIEQALHSSLTVIGFYILWWYHKNNQMTDKDFFLIVLFISIHSIAARWLYTNTPYNQWIQSLFGFSLNQQLGWKRNHIDRLVHFLYGFCFTPSIVSYVINKYKQSLKNGFYVAVALIMLTSLWYEWFEWLIAILLSDKNAESYNGQQGDIWDAHKDMLIATVGSLVWMKAYLTSQQSTLLKE